MSKKKKVEEELSENMVQLNLTNVLAAAIKNMGILAVPMRDVLEDYAEYNIGVTMDEDSNMILLELVHQSQVQENSDES